MQKTWIVPYFFSLCLSLSSAYGIAAEKPKVNTEALVNPQSKASDPLPPKLDIDETDVRALTNKLTVSGAGNVPAILKSLNVNPTAADAVQVMAGIRALAVIDAKAAVPDLILFVKECSNPEMTEEGWKAIGKLAVPASLPGMLFILETPLDMPYRKLVAQIAAMQALIAISQRGDGPAVLVAEIEKLRVNASATAKLRMVEVLEKLDTNLSRSTLSSLLSETDRDVQRVTLSAIARADDPQVIGRIQLLLASSDPLVKKEAAAALGRCKAVAAVPALIKLLDSGDKGVRSNVIGALRNMTGRAFASTSMATSWWDEENADSQERFNALLDQLKQGQPRLAPLIVEELSKIPLMQDKVPSALLLYTNHADFRVRAAVAETLGQTPPVLRTYSMLIGRLNDSSDVVRVSAWHSLKKMTGQNLPNDREIWSQWFQKRS
jgi:HEAT repeat protein